MSEDHGNHEGGEGEGGHKKGHGSHGPPHGGGHEEHAGAPEWLISFADNVALLMGFFVILLAMNMGPKGKSAGGSGDGKGGSNDAAMMDFIVGMREAFNNPPDAKSNNPRERELAKWSAARDKDSKNTTTSPQGNKNKAQAIEQGFKVDITAVVDFDTNSALISEAAKRVLGDAVGKLKGQTWIIEVRGHVSAREARPEGQPDIEAAYGLGYQRAMVVAMELASKGVPWRQLRIVDCADNERATPLAQDAVAHRHNQRVELVITKDAAPPDPYLQDPGKR